MIVAALIFLFNKIPILDAQNRNHKIIKDQIDEIKKIICLWI